MRRLGSISLIVVFATLVGTAGIMWRFQQRAVPAGATQPPPFFAQLKALALPGWTVTEEPLGETELSRAIVEKTLRFDQATFLKFKSPTREFAVYAAYWSPGKVELRTVNAHTPDTCWVNSGWESLERVHGYTGSGAAGELQPGEYRCYRNRGNVQYVAFWHLLDGRPVPMWRNGFPTLSFMLGLFVGDRSRLNGEQVFIRLSSPHEFSVLWNEPVFRQVLDILGPLESSHAVGAR